MFRQVIVTALQVAVISHLGCAALLEICPAPWKTFHFDGTISGLAESEECKNRCVGFAFRNDDGKLICFYGKDTAQRISNIRIRSKKPNEACQCGYNLSGYSNHKWTSCNFSVAEISNENCDELCQAATVYLYRWGRRRSIIHCDREKREHFYRMDGQIGRHLQFRYNSASRYRTCACGISDLNLKRIIPKRSESPVTETFEECSQPWKVSNMYNFRKVETCYPHCRDKCKIGYGFFHDGKLFCYHRKSSAKRRSSYQDGSQGYCECGYVKQSKKNNKTKEFVPCDPPIFRNDLKPRKCKVFCSKSYVFVYQRKNAPWDLRCFYNLNITALKIHPLLGKCDERVYSRKDDSVKYTKCRCGLGAPNSDKLSIDPLGNDEIKLPVSWPLKKKRSNANRGDSVKTSLKIDTNATKREFRHL